MTNDFQIEFQTSPYRLHLMDSYQMWDPSVGETLKLEVREGSNRRKKILQKNGYNDG